MVKGTKLTALYNANILGFESMAFSEGVIKKARPDDPTAATTWFYYFYLRDHLGSTRMVIADDGRLASALMYQPYGVMEELAVGGG